MSAAAPCDDSGCGRGWRGVLADSRGIASWLSESAAGLAEERFREGREKAVKERDGYFCIDIGGSAGRLTNGSVT